METVSEIIGSMRAVAPPGQGSLDDDTLRQLRELTQSLIAVKTGAAQEHARFLAIAERGLCLPEAELAGRLRDATVLVTGGTGCIGSALLAQLAARCPGRLVSVSRGVTDNWPRHAAAEYRYADVRDRAVMDRLISETSPIWSSMSPRSATRGWPDRGAPHGIHDVLGTRTVLTAAAKPACRKWYAPRRARPCGRTRRNVHRLQACRGMGRVGGGRQQRHADLRAVTHVLDNSIIYKRLLSWADEADEGVIRLHSPDIAFYVQSALESAQLLLLACLGSQRAEFRMFAISDLGWPVSLMDLALAVLARSGSATPIYVSGYDQGYEEIPFPGLYDPMTAGDVSPLLNAFEAGAVVGSPCPMVDGFRVDMAPEPRAVKLLTSLAEVCDRTQDPGTVRGALNELSWSLLDCTLRSAPGQALMRSAAMAHRHSQPLGAEHRRILE